MRSAMKAAISALSLPPCSMSCSVCGADLQPLLVLVVPLGDPRVEVPAVVVEARRVGDLRGSRRASCPRARGSRRRRRRPGRRCRRCSSALRPGMPRKRSTRTSVSPSAELRRWPMCAALFGLMAVCSTIALPPAWLRRAGCGRRSAVRAGTPAGRERSSGSRSAPRRRARTPSSVPKAPAISCAMARGALRSRRASSNATGVPRSPRSRLGGYSRAIGGCADASSE